ncbi:MAG: glutathione S-transferase family protein [Caulobacteraceae bacterium]|nr:glutathione S-transferase family protein [Caulobacteraceae bacterium]
MKLYSVDLSPYATRVRMAIHAKGLDVEIAPPPGGDLKSAEYLAVNPMGKIPALVLDDGTVIPESDTIVEYLEDAYPQRPLRPATPEGKARARLIARVAELYVMTQGLTLFGQMNPAARDQAVVDDAFGKIDEALVHLNHVMGPGPYAVEGDLTTADCALVPLLFFMGVFGQVFGKGDVMAKYGKLGPYWAFIQTDPVMAEGIAEMAEALRVRMGGG